MSERVLVKIEGFDDCIVGTVCGVGQPEAICYSYEKIILKLMKDLDCPAHEAIEYAEFNILFTFIQDTMPVFLYDYEEY